MATDEVLGDSEFFLSSEKYRNADYMGTLLDYHSVAGVAITEIHEGRSLSRSYGRTMIDSGGELLNEETHFYVGSVSKAMAGLVLYHLKHRGLLSLQDPVAKFLPATSAVEQKFQGVTLESLLTHSSGLGNETLDIIDPDLDDETWLRSLGKLDVVFPPGRYASVCNMGFRVLGYVIKKVSGRSFKEIAEEILATEVGLKTAVFRPEQEDVLAKISCGHDHFSHAVVDTTYDMPELLDQNGGLCISNHEFGALLQYFMELKSGVRNSPLYDAEDFKTCFETHFDMQGASFQKMGHQWNMFTYQDQTFYKTSGSNYGMHGFLIMGPDAASGLAINVNKFGADAISYSVVRDWALQRYGVNFDFPEVSECIAEPLRGSYAGTYANPDDRTVVVSENDSGLSLVVTLDGELEIPEYPGFSFQPIQDSELNFLAEDDRIYDRGIEFIREEGRIAYVRYSHRIYRRTF